MDHVYVKDSMLIGNLPPIETVIGDHKLISMTINEPKSTPFIDGSRAVCRIGLSYSTNLSK